MAQLSESTSPLVDEVYLHFADSNLFIASVLQGPWEGSGAGVYLCSRV